MPVSLTEWLSTPRAVVKMFHLPNVIVAGYPRNMQEVVNE